MFKKLLLEKVFQEMNPEGIFTFHFYYLVTRFTSEMVNAKTYSESCQKFNIEHLRKQLTAKSVNYFCKMLHPGRWQSSEHAYEMICL